MADWKPIVVSSKTHKRLKILSAIYGRPMSELVETALEQQYFSASPGLDESSETLEQYVPASP